MDTEERKRAWLYIRTVHPDEKDSPSYQISCVRKYAADNNYDVIGETISIEGGNFLERDGLTKVSSVIQAGLVDVVIVQNMSRISSDLSLVRKYCHWASKYDVQIIAQGAWSMADFTEIRSYEDRLMAERIWSALIPDDKLDSFS